jgi:hypothetical protein
VAPAKIPYAFSLSFSLVFPNLWQRYKIKGENPNDSCPFFIKADKVTVNQLLRAFSKAGYEARKLKEGEKPKKN